MHHPPIQPEKNSVEKKDCHLKKKRKFREINLQYDLLLKSSYKDFLLEDHESKNVVFPTVWNDDRE